MEPGANHRDRRRLVPRHALDGVRSALADFRVVVVNGPRQAGKTTLLRALRSGMGGTFLSLDEPGTLAAALTDPAGFLMGRSEPVLIDEIQRGGDPLLLAIKLQVDEDPRPGRFVLTGSTRFLTVPTLSESLAGRVHIVDLWPFSQGEVLSRRERFIDVLFEDPTSLRHLPPSRLGKLDYFELVCAGGFPDAVRASTPRARSAWLRSYARTLPQRDVRDISRIREVAEMERMIRLLGALSAQELVTATLTRALDLDEKTVRHYLGLLETVYLIHRVPSWSRRLTSKVKRRPKVYMVDSGLTAQLQGIDPTGLNQPGAAATGPLVETFVWGELAKQQTWAETDAGLYHFRDRGGPEVDVILETAGGRVAAVEVKAAASVAHGDFRWLGLLRDRLGTSFVHGVVMYAGKQSLSFGDRLTALPISALWEA